MTNNTNKLNTVIISPPFGNYLSLPNTISVLGSYTLHERKGAIKQFIKTFRPYNGGFVNKIGLRNSGILSIPPKSKKLSKNILSLSVLDYSEWFELSKYLNFLKNTFNIYPKFLELNLSCPNVTSVKVNHNILELFSNFDCILKLPPNENIFRYIEDALQCGINKVHLCNTIPIPQGGLSGPDLKEKSLHYIQKVRRKYKDITIIGGGGIYNKKDINLYHQAGADCFSLATIIVKNPFKVLPIIRYANNTTSM